MILRLLIVLLIAGGFAAWRLDRFELPELGQDVPPAVASTVASEQPSQSVAAPVPAVSSFSQIVDRPLFRPDRRPPAPVRAAAPPPPPPRAAPEPTVAWTLIGVGQNENGRVAILRISGTSEPLRARIGDQLRGRIVKDISAGEITLEDTESGEIIKLVLPKEN